MTEVHDAISQIEERIEELAEAAERSRKLVLAGKLAMWTGGALALVTLAGVMNLPPTAFVVGLTGCLGGIAMAGSSSSTLDQTMAEIAELERRRSQAIDGIGLRVIPGRRG
jgi:hypothetical protein